VSRAERQENLVRGKPGAEREADVAEMVEQERRAKQEVADPGQINTF